MLETGVQHCGLLRDILRLLRSGGGVSVNKNVTQLIARWQEGDSAALDELTPFVYDELKRLARNYMRRESPAHTLQATALVNEAFIRLAGTEVDYSSRAHFVVTAARMMRRILVDHARSRLSQKRGGGAVHVSFDEGTTADRQPSPELLALDEALDRLERQDARLASIVELVFFGGLTYEEAAGHLKVSRSALYEDLSFAKAWLKKNMH